LSDPDELPQNATLLFSLKAQTPSHFSRGEKIEVETADGSYTTMLTLANGLTLQDSHTALATLDPSKAFGSSAFGPLKFRVVTDGGVTGDWQPLATLVRLPQLSSLKCDANAEGTCQLHGSDLFLVDAVAQDEQFKNPVQVPDGFPGWTLPVPHPGQKGQLYMKLRDDPSVVNLVTLTPQIEGGAKQAAKEYRPPYVSPGNDAGVAGASAGVVTPAAGSAVLPTGAPARGNTHPATTAPASGSPQAAPNAAAPTAPASPKPPQSTSQTNAGTPAAANPNTTGVSTTSAQGKAQKKSTGKSTAAQVLQPTDPGNII